MGKFVTKIMMLKSHGYSSRMSYHILSFSDRFIAKVKLHVPCRATGDMHLTLYGDNEESVL